MTNILMTRRPVQGQSTLRAAGCVCPLPLSDDTSWWRGNSAREGEAGSPGPPHHIFSDFLIMETLYTEPRSYQLVNLMQ